MYNNVVSIVIDNEILAPRMVFGAKVQKEV